MNVALILTGHMRCYEEAFESFKTKGLVGSNYDVFIQTWTEIGYYTGKGYMKPTADGFIKTESTDKGYAAGQLVDSNDLSKRYNPLTLVIEDFANVESMIEKRKEHFVKAYTRPKNTISQFYKIQAGIRDMINSGKQYDLVIRTRPDLLLETRLPVLQAFNPSIFYTNCGHNSINRGIGDQLHISSYDNMVKFAGIYDHLEQLYDFLGVSCPHMFVEEYLKRCGIPFFEIPNEVTAMKLMHSPYGPYQEPDGTGIYTPKE